MTVTIKKNDASVPAPAPDETHEPWPWFSGDAKSPAVRKLPPPPPWRRFDQDTPHLQQDFALPDKDDSYWQRARSYCTPAEIVDAVNAALALRRPLLVSGRPGSGKTTLIYRVAYELALGPVLVWPVNSRTTLRDGLYDYNAIARLQDSQRQAEKGLGDYITLRALGTALVPRKRPRALLIDELDKADPDLPNDLLNVLEEGGFDIPELIREDDSADGVAVRTTVVPNTAPEQESRATVRNGHLQCHEFPFTVITSNGEREFSPAFLRRCIRVELGDPKAAQLQAIVREQLGAALAEAGAARVKEFADGGEKKAATDQLLNALHLVHGINGTAGDEATKKRMDDLFALLTQPLD